MLDHVSLHASPHITVIRQGEIIHNCFEVKFESVFILTAWLQFLFVE